MTLQSYFQTSIFFSNGVIASLILFSSTLAIDLLHSKNAVFSYYCISVADISLVHFGLRGIFKGIYYGVWMFSLLKNLLILFSDVPLSAPTIYVPFTIIY